MQQYKLTLGCIFLVLFLTGSTNIKADSVPDAVEFAILKKFYDSLGGSAWTKKTNWPATGSWPASATSAQFGTWYGVTVVNGDITQIVLNSNKLTGKLPSNIGDLQALKILDVNTNTTITGSIPASLATISTLQQVNLYRNTLSGTIPTDIFNNAGLKVFNVSSNALTGTIPSTVVNATALTQLILGPNKLTGGIPANIGNLFNLTYLGLSGNTLTGTIPESITNLKQLTTLQLNDNQLSGSIPANIGSISLLSRLYLYNNLLSGLLPSSLGNLTSLTELQLQGNNLTGTIPSTLGNLTTLTTLYLFNNQLTGSIPESLGNLTNLVYLYLYQNKLSGDIPSTLGSLTKLQYLGLQNNLLTGKLPRALGNMAALLTLNASFNGLSGEIPGEYGNLKKLQNFYVQSNKLSGSLPTALSGMTQVRYFYVNDNGLTGPVPADYSALSQLVAFYLYNNTFSGDLPAGLTTTWTKLAYFYVQNNQFTGSFPTSIGTSTTLAGINASVNRFTTLPASLLNLPVLTVADFSNNELVTAPAFAGQVNKAKLTLKLNNNRLDFSVLEPLVGSGINVLTILPQNDIQDVTSITATENSLLTIPARPITANTTIVWEKQRPDGTWSGVASLNQGATGKTFIRNAFALSDEGVYHWKMTNSVFTGTTLQSAPITVKLALSFALDNWAFQYQYDARHRVIGKKVPGAEWVCIVYDTRDRVVMTQDGQQRKANKWSYTLYDALNRPVVTGVYTHTKYLSQTGMDSLISTTALYETYTGTGSNHGYSNTVFASAAFNASGFDAQTVTYYDAYDFKAGWGNEYNYSKAQVTSVTANGVTYQQDTTAFARVTGQVTGVKVKTLEGQPRWLYTINYYDDHYRLVQSKTDNIKGGTDCITNLYDFTGKVLASKSTHSTGKLTWQNIYYTKADGDNLVKTTTTVTWAGASSAEQIPANQDGWAEVTASDLVSNRFFGLSNQDANQNYTSIKYAFYLTQALLRVYTNGSLVYNVPSALAVGDRLRITRESGYINFYKNGVKVYTANNAQQLSTESLIVDVSLGTIPGTIRFARVSAGQSVSQSVLRRFEYDHAGRLLKTWHKLNNNPEVLLAQNEYNELGQLIDKKLYSTQPAGTADNARAFKQSVDYRYNIRGWLTSINNSTLTNNAVNSDAANTPKDLFGLELAYNQDAGTTNALLYNGNISAMKWSNNLGLGSTKENAYNYAYDAMNRIVQADFRQKKSTWDLPEYTDDNGNTQNAAAYSEQGYQYDLNGNILQLKRKTAKGVDMDVLTYTYGTGSQQSNKLLSVSDAAIDKTIGFIDGNTGDDYTYDANGSMVSDLNKGITSITYNYLNLPFKITKTTGDYVVYTYDATGRKLRQQVFNASAVQQKRSDYVGEYFYENDTLKFINHEEGRVVTTSTTPEYQYFLKDHLGNVRMTFTTKTEADTTIATMEPTNAVTESSQYLNYDEAVTLNSTLFDHTHTLPGHAAANTHFSILLRGENGSIHEKYGLTKSLSVMPGDTVKMEVFAKYIDLDGGSISTQVQNVLGAIANGSSSTGPLVDGGAAGSLGGSAFPFLGLLSYTDDSNNTAPKAYMNWLVFDRDYNFKNGGYRPITRAAAETGNGLSTHEQLTKDLIIEEAGYVYIYLSNEAETPVDVFFDDFKVVLAKGPVLEIEDYFPFGLIFNSYKRESALPNRWKFQGQEHIDDLGLNWDSFKWRNHQPEIGRFFNIDPLSEKYVYNSPYAFSENKVTGHIELEGLEAVENTYNQDLSIKNVSPVMSKNMPWKVDHYAISIQVTETQSTTEFNENNIAISETTTVTRSIHTVNVKGGGEPKSLEKLDSKIENYYLSGGRNFTVNEDQKAIVTTTEKNLLKVTLEGGSNTTVKSEVKNSGQILLNAKNSTEIKKAANNAEKQYNTAMQQYWRFIITPTKQEKAHPSTSRHR